MATEPSDADLVVHAQRDPEAFDALYRRYLPAVYRFVRARVLSTEEAEDVTSAVFMDALAGLASYREQGRFTAWLFTIARRHIIAHGRRSARTDLVDAGDIVAPPQRTGEDWFALEKAMARLTDDRRHALELRFFADLSIEQVAATMGKGESATKMLIHRALAQLRDVLQGGPVG